MGADGSQLGLGFGAPPDLAHLRELRGRIPFAFNVTSTGRREPVEAHQARRKTEYVCPVCDAAVFRKGDDLVDGRARKLDTGRAAPRPHFSHRKGASDCPSTGEHWMYVLAKLYVYLAVLEWLRGEAEAPQIAIAPSCGHRATVPIPASTRDVHLEYAGAREDGRVRPDVVLTNEDKEVVLVVEVWHPLLVPPAKGPTLEGRGGWIVEVAAEGILSEANAWSATKTWRYACATCSPSRDQFAPHSSSR